MWKGLFIFAIEGKTKKVKSFMGKIFVTMWILFGIYILVLVMIMADLWSGVRKARSLGEVRKSYKYRRTVGSAVWYFEQYYGNQLWFFPFMTLGGAFLLCLIEIKSIYEKAEDKEQFDKAGQVMGKIIINRENVEEIAASIKEYLNDKDDKQLKNE